MFHGCFKVFSWFFQGFFIVVHGFYVWQKSLCTLLGKPSDLFGGGQVISADVLSQMNQWLPCSCDFQKDGVNHGPMCLLWVDGHIGICIYTLED